MNISLCNENDFLFSAFVSHFLPNNERYLILLCNRLAPGKFLVGQELSRLVYNIPTATCTQLGILLVGGGWGMVSAEPSETVRLRDLRSLADSQTAADSHITVRSAVQTLQTWLVCYNNTEVELQVLCCTASFHMYTLIQN